MHIVYQIASAGAAAFAGILPIAAPEPQEFKLISAVISQSATQPASIGGTACKKVGQIRDFQSQRLICLKVNAKGGSTSGPSLVWVKISSPKSTTKPTSTTTAETTTSVPRICQEGSVCKVGDQGPGGGWIFFVNPDKTSTDWKYLELAPTTARLNYDAPLPKSDPYKGEFSTNFPEALLHAERYKTKTKDDWFLPTFEQLALAIENLWYLPDSPIAFRECLTAIQCVYQPFWTNSESSDKNLARVVRVGWTNTKFGEPKKINPKSLEPTFKTTGSYQFVVAIRGEKIASTPTPTSTTTAKSCEEGGLCSVGDRGPGGGEIFYVAPWPQAWGRYLEFLPTMISSTTPGCSNKAIDSAAGLTIGTGANNTEAIVSSCERNTLADFVSRFVSTNGTSDWILPSRDELEELWKYYYSKGQGGGAGGQGSRPYWWKGNNSVLYTSSMSDTDVIWGRYWMEYRIEPSGNTPPQFQTRRSNLYVFPYEITGVPIRYVKLK